MISLGYKAPQETTDIAVANTAALLATKATVTTDDVIATSVAATVAKSASLPVAGNVAEIAVSTQIKSEFPQSSEANTISKPQIVELSSATRSITTYTVKNGDSLAALAAKYNVSADTIKWENDMTGDSLSAGTSLRILPTSGITYVVKSGDTVASIAEKYKANASRITLYNDLEASSLKPGLKIIIPNGVLPNNERPGYVAPVVTYFTTGYGTWSGDVLNMTYRYTPQNGEDIGGYALGNCTAYAYLRRVQLGLPVSKDWGNAYTWATGAASMGYRVDNQPSRGAIIQSGNHVGIVEEVLSNGDLRITDMNYGYRLHWVAERIIPASTVPNYKYIH